MFSAPRCWSLRGKSLSNPGRWAGVPPEPHAFVAYALSRYALFGQSARRASSTADRTARSSWRSNCWLRTGAKTSRSAPRSKRTSGGAYAASDMDTALQRRRHRSLHALSRPRGPIALLSGKPAVFEALSAAFLWWTASATLSLLFEDGQASRDFR